MKVYFLNHTAIWRSPFFKEWIYKKVFSAPMNSRAEIEEILKHRFFVAQTGYPPQNGFLDYGPVLTQIKQQIVDEFRRVFVDEDMYEIEPSAVLPYEVLKNSGHVDKFCDVIITDGANIYRADHFIEDRIGEVLTIPDSTDLQSLMDTVLELKSRLISSKKEKLLEGTNVHKNTREQTSSNCETEQFSEEEVQQILSNFCCTQKHLADFGRSEIDFIVNLHNLHSPSGKPFGPSRDFNLIFRLNEKQFLRPELAQSQFTNFRKLFEMNGERLPFSSLCIGRSYRNEISARGGMLRTKEFEQAEIEYFTEDGSHTGFEALRNTSVLILPNTCFEPYQTTLGEAYDTKTIPSKAICYFVAKAQEFCLAIGIRLENLRYRQHKQNEMAHYANDCWDVEVRTFSGWVECAGIADRSSFDLSVHSKNVNTNVKRPIEPKTVYKIAINKAELGKVFKNKLRDFEAYVDSLDQEFILSKRQDNSIEIEFEGASYSCALTSRKVDCEFFVPRVIEPSFGISRILYSLVEQSFTIRDGRSVLSLKPKMCYKHCVITFLKYLDEFEPMVKVLKLKLRSQAIRFQTSDRGCSIGKKYSSCDELGIPFFITFDFETLKDKKVTIRERDSTSQIRIDVCDAPFVISDLVSEKSEWSALFKQFGISN